ncbi:MAG: murein biosynthesis integral membrane protein MurJ [Chloroflexi bacterium]|nr:murein biosynthesis integral membrane protein MurJ [Chloroflexota bacterium]
MRAGTLLFIGLLASRVLAVGRDVVISAQFGTSGDLDLYIAAFRIPDLIFTLISGGALGSALVPVFARAWNAGPGGDRPDPAYLDRLARTVLTAVTLIASVGAVTAMVVASSLVEIIGAGFGPDARLRLVDLVRLMLVQPVFLGAGEVLTRYLNVRGHFAVTAFAPAVYTLAIVVGAAVFGPALGTTGLAIGVVTGAFGFLAVQLVASLRLGIGRSPAGANGRSVRADLREIFTLMVPRLVGQGAVQLSFVATTRLATYLPSGRVASLNYAWALMMLPLGAFAMTLANAAFPTFAAQAARGDRDALATTGRQSMATILCVMVPATAVVVVFGSLGIEVLFARRAFTAESVALTASALAAYGIGLPAHGILEVQMRLSFALSDTRTPVVIGVVAMVANVLLAFVLVEPLGHVGIALSLSVAATLEAVLLGVVLHRKLPGLHTSALGDTTVRVLVATIAATAVALGIQEQFLSDGLPVVLRAVTVIGLFGVTYLAAAAILRVRELGVIYETQVRPRLARARASG